MADNFNIPSIYEPIMFEYIMLSHQNSAFGSSKHKEALELTHLLSKFYI